MAIHHGTPLVNTPIRTPHACRGVINKLLLYTAESVQLSYHVSISVHKSSSIIAQQVAIFNQCFAHP